MQATLARLAAEGANAGQIANTAVSTWRGVDAALSPIIGQRGVAALYKRSLHLTRRDHPWLAAVYDAASQADEFAALQEALVQQTSSNAAIASDTLLQTFCDLLTILIGESLAERLLRPVWETSTSGDAAQDTLL